MGQQTTSKLSAIGAKISDQVIKIGGRLNQRFDLDRKFKLKVIGIFKQLNVTGEDISELEQLVELEAHNYASK